MRRVAKEEDRQAVAQISFLAALMMALSACAAIWYWLSFGWSCVAVYALSTILLCFMPSLPKKENEA